MYDIAKSNCKIAVLIEDADELDTTSIENCNNVGVMAGASTPRSSIEEVIRKLEDYEK